MFSGRRKEGIVKKTDHSFGRREREREREESQRERAMERESENGKR